jgi:O-antigen/teichoic acid export membrane protein
MTARRQTSKRAAWGLADQAFSSITNFALSAIVARTVTPAQFGAFALIFAAYLLVLGVVRAFSTLPLLVRYSAVAPERWREGARRATGWAIVGGVVGAAICVMAGLVFSGARGPLLALAISLPGLMLQETWRLAFVARGTPAAALVNDVVWAVFLVPALALAISTDARTAEPFILAWGASGTLAGLFGLLQARFLPSLRGVVDWTRINWDISGRQLGEFATLSGTNQLVMYAAGGIGGLVSAAALRGGQVLLGPLRTAYQGVWFVALSEFVRILSRRPGSLFRVALFVSLFLGFGGLVYGAVFVAFGSTFGPMLLGETWVHAQPLMVPLTISAATSGFWLGPNVGLRAMEEPARSLRVRLAIGALTVVGGVAGVFLDGARGAAWGLAISGVIGVWLWWRQFALARKEHADRPPHEPGPDDVLEARTAA